MFQLKKKEPGANAPDTANVLPNSYGKVRTFKEDLANFEKGDSDKDISETNNFSFPPAPEKLSSEPSPAIREIPETKPPFPEKKSLPNNPFQSVQATPPISSANSILPAFKSSPSQSFFEEKPVLEETASPKQNEASPPTKKSGKKFVILAIIFLVLIIAGSGFYYYWFFLKKTSSPQASSTTATQNKPAPAASSNSQNKNLRQLVVDTSQSPTEIKSAVQKFSTDFASTAAENDLAEVKILDKNNQPVAKKDFLAGFGLTIPETVTGKLSEDFSLFAKKEQGAVKLGLVFKTVTSANLASEMQNWEPTLLTDLNSLYLVQTSPSATTAFNSAKYKNADIRYFNFSSPVDTSLDYSVISNFLVIGTSKDSVRSILDYMSEK